MKRFTFRLDRMLRLRSQEENDKARTLGEARREEDEAREAAARAGAHLEQCRVQQPEADATTRPAGLLHQLNRTIDAAAKALRAAEDEQSSRAEAVQDAEEEFGEARRERRVMERLRDHSKEDFDQETNREQRKENDGIAIQRWLSLR